MMAVFRSVVALAAVASQSWAQCPMCQAAAAAQSPAAARALNAGIVILFLPAVGLFCGVFLFAFLRRDSRDTEETTGGRP